MSPSNEKGDSGAAQVSKRERGKLAQREYRKRHASRFQSLKDENLKLKNAIRKIHKAASKDGNLGQDFLVVLSEAATIAGLDDAQQKASADMSDSDERQSSLIRWPALESAPTDQISSGQPSPGDVLNVRDTPPSPKLSPPIWRAKDRLVRIYDAPPDVMPYLGEGLYTFAGCLYWAAVCYSVSLWRKSKKLPQPDPSYQNRLDRMFNHSKHLSDREFLFSVAQTRIEFRKKGFIDCYYRDDHVAENYTLAGVYNRVKQEYEERNEAIQWWKSPQEVERYVKPHLTEEESAQLQQIVEGRGSPEAFEVFAPLFETLVENFVCFGDGPRWNLVHVSVNVGAWLQGRRK